jgi:hypothetical protein
LENLKKAGKAVVKRSGARPGTHNAVFQGAFDLPEKTDGPSYGPAVLLKWRADDGEEPTAIVGSAPTQKNACGRILAGMLGRPLMPDEQIDWAQFEGQRFLCQVITNQSGNGTKVHEVARV